MTLIKDPLLDTKVHTPELDRVKNPGNFTWNDRLEESPVEDRRSIYREIKAMENIQDWWNTGLVSVLGITEEGVNLY